MKRPYGWRAAGASLGLAALLSACGAPQLKLPHTAFIYNTAISIATPPVTDINPVTATGAANAWYDEMVYQTLISLRPNGGIAPGLAKSWSSTHQDTVWTIKLNPYAKWWNGRPVSARDVQWTLTFYKDPASHFVRRTELAHVTDVRVLSPTTVEIRLDRPDPDFLANVLSPRGGLWILPSFLLHRLSPDKVVSSGFLTNMRDVVGSGPFRPYRMTASGMRWIANPHYFLGTPGTKYLRWRWRTAPDVALRAGKANIGWTMANLHLTGYASGTAVASVQWGLTLTPTDAPVPMRVLNQAISHATMRTRLPGVPAFDNRWPGQGHFTSPSPSSLASLMHAWGYHRTSRGWTNAAGTVLAFSVQEPSSLRAQALLRQLVGQWRDQGLSVRIVPRSYTGPVDARLELIPALPQAEPLDASLVPIIWPIQRWYVQKTIVHWTPNVWQPFYQVEAWRVRTDGQKVR
ncbi:MAG: ABC transporter substrate-binding protein [Firmicutes bacterium]|nr:ABC transporter substrate-binding protein [Bacillota bacterium]